MTKKQLVEAIGTKQINPSDNKEVIITSFIKTKGGWDVKGYEYKGENPTNEKKRMWKDAFMGTAKGIVFVPGKILDMHIK